jgi:hypothetical protein
VTPRASSTLAVTLLVILPAVMLFPVWSNPTSAGEDDVLYYFPVRAQTGQALARGEWPMRDPLTAGGAPVFGDPQSAVLFPGTWLFAIWPATLAYSANIVLAFTIMGTGMWVYLGTLGLSRPARLLAAMAMMFSGFMVGHRVHLAVIQSACFLPWGLTALEWLTARPPRGLALLVPTGALAVLAGHWPTVIHMGMIWAAYLLLRVRPLARGLLTAGVAGVLVVAVCWPQLQATVDVMAQATRGQIRYAAVGENSYCPAAAVLWLFPFLMGTRTPNLYGQPWWGAWHLCEMLGYVGLVTLVLAGAAAWRLFRRPDEGAADSSWRPVVRTWVWITAGATVFMLGYYLPTYWLVHGIPVLGIVRCPARMILAVDVAVATLAAVALHAILTGSPQASAVAAAARCGATRVLPLSMGAALLLVLLLGLVGLWWWPAHLPMPFAGTATEALQSLVPWRPAVLIPLLLLVATAAAVKAWLARPRRRVWLLLLLLVVDLGTVVRWVDVPAEDVVGPDAYRSPAAAWLKVHGGEAGSYRIWALGNPYGHRQPELLLARTNVLHGVATISTYGPFISPSHVEALGFDIYGTNSRWRDLLADRDLLRRCGVRYLLAEAGSDYARTIAGVREARPGGRSFYRPVAACAAVRPGDPPVMIYELAGDTAGLMFGDPPDTGFDVEGAASVNRRLIRVTLPATGVWLAICAGWWLRRQYFQSDT